MMDNTLYHHRVIYDAFIVEEIGWISLSSTHLPDIVKWSYCKDINTNQPQIALLLPKLIFYNPEDLYLLIKSCLL
jgi:hypothetical protein